MVWMSWTIWDMELLQNLSEDEFPAQSYDFFVGFTLNNFVEQDMLRRMFLSTFSDFPCVRNMGIRFQTAELQPPGCLDKAMFCIFFRSFQTCQTRAPWDPAGPGDLS